MDSQRVLRLISQEVLCRAVTAVAELPVDGSVEVVIRPATKDRTITQNATYWGVRLAEIATQAVVDGKRFSADAWHYHMKDLFLPTGAEPDIARRVRKPETYTKYIEGVDGRAILVGSTTRLTTFGFSEYTGECEAHMAQEYGVRFAELRHLPR